MPEAKEASFVPIDAEAVAVALKHAAGRGHFPANDDDLTASSGAHKAGLLKKPLAVMYDLDVWDGMLDLLASSFGKGCMHALAVKGTGISSLLKRAVERGFGLECASIGEVLHAQAVGCPADRIVFDSPCKTRAELAYALRQGLHLNVDNFEELKRLAEVRKSLENELPEGGVVGLRINPLCGAGKIAALSVSLADSKFAVPVDLETEILAVFKEYGWLNCIHVHVGSGGMGMHVLVEGVKTACEFSKRINRHLGRRQVTVLDMGGGLHPDYQSDILPGFDKYADQLRQQIDGLLRSPSCSSQEVYFDKVVTEFGQALSAKAGFLATRLEYVKQVQVGGDKSRSVWGRVWERAWALAFGSSHLKMSCQIAVGHFGADLCPRQCYTKEHKRRIEFYDGESCSPMKRSRQCGSYEETKTTHLAGPLCFQGDFPARDLEAPALRPGDFAVLREGGSNTLALFSRHCSRMAPPVLGYRIRREGGAPAVQSLEVLKEAESIKQLCGFWGADVPPGLASVVAEVA
mmetsp:Transcript_51187/g.92018  ORF Transcript_51187/g.92018 Transcript_51187/m.92018 type:complete len:519 (+) Transcript_51187:40-1596(+)